MNIYLFVSRYLSPCFAQSGPCTQRDDIKAAFHASAKEGGWVECNGRVGANFYVRNSKPAVRLFPELLEQIRECLLLLSLIGHR